MRRWPPSGRSTQAGGSDLTRQAFPGTSPGGRRRALRKSGARARRTNTVAATSLAIGGSLFAIGALLAQSGVDATAYCSVYLVGGVFFSSGGYASVLLVLNAPRLGEDGSPALDPWRWWGQEPRRIEWLSAAVLFIGTLVFGINLIDSFIAGLGVGAANRLVWSPDMIGCSLFLISGHLAMLEVGRGRRVLRPRELTWWIVVVNQLGSVLFMIAAIASFIRPIDSEAVNIGIANWGTFTGAACFAIGGLLQEFERPEDP